MMEIIASCSPINVILMEFIQITLKQKENNQVICDLCGLCETFTGPVSGRGSTKLSSKWLLMTVVTYGTRQSKKQHFCFLKIIPD